MIVQVSSRERPAILTIAGTASLVAVRDGTVAGFRASRVVEAHLEHDHYRPGTDQQLLGVTAVMANL